MKEQACYIG